MKKFILHHAKKDSDNINKLSFKNHKSMIDYIDEHCYYSKRNIVYLVTNNDNNDVFVSDNYLSILDFMQTKNLFRTVGNYYLQEYNSYEEAYKVALNIAEISPLCYE